MHLRGRYLFSVWRRNDSNSTFRTINGILVRSGQVCVAPTRVYVQRGIAKAFIDAYVTKMKAAATTLGDPQDPSIAVGPLVDQASFDRVNAMIKRGREEAELVVGGMRYGDEGCFIEPTVFLNPKPDAQIYREEIFGPVSIVKTFDTEEEVIGLANETEYGLMSGVFTRDITRAMRVSSALESGVVGINCVSYVRI